MSGFVTPGTPNLTDFLTFLSNQVQIPSAALPAGSPWPGYALAQAIGLVVNPPAPPVPVAYSLACYNGATHILFNITPDQPGETYFTNARSTAGFGLVQPSMGLIGAASDQGTSSTTVVPDWAKTLTIGQLDFYKTAWGRSFLAWNQSYGPTIWGLT